MKTTQKNTVIRMKSDFFSEWLYWSLFSSSVVENASKPWVNAETSSQNRKDDICDLRCRNLATYRRRILPSTVTQTRRNPHARGVYSRCARCSGEVDTLPRFFANLTKLDANRRVRIGVVASTWKGFTTSADPNEALQKEPRLGP